MANILMLQFLKTYGKKKNKNQDFKKEKYTDPKI